MMLTAGIRGRCRDASPAHPDTSGGTLESEPEIGLKQIFLVVFVISSVDVPMHIFEVQFDVGNEVILQRDDNPGFG